MTDMSINEIENLLAKSEELLQKANAAIENGSSPDHKLASMANYGDLALARLVPLMTALRQLLDAQKWRPISELPEKLKDGKPFLIGGGQQRGLTWSDTAFWHDGSECHPGRGSAGLFAESDRGNLLIARNVSAEVFMPLPLPPLKEQGEQGE